MMYSKDKRSIEPFSYKGKRLATGFDVYGKNKQVREVSMFSRGVQNQMKALWSRQFASSINIDPFHAQNFDDMTSRLFNRDF